VLDESFALVLVGKGAGDIESCKQGKNVGLKNLNQEFKESQSDPECKGKWTDELQTDDPFEKVIATQDKNQQKQVHNTHEFRANVVTGHIIANEAVNTLTGELKLGRHNRGFPRCQQEERGNQKNGEKYQKYWLCGIGIVAKDWREVEVIGAGWNKTTTIGA
jgi:hypothetical protein